MEGLTEGRIVHFVLDVGRWQGEHRPAIVVKAFRTAGEENIQSTFEDGRCQLQVFTDGINDDLPSVMWRTSVLYDENAAEGTWHWIEKA